MCPPCEHFVLALNACVCVCLCASCTRNTELCPGHVKADQRLSRSMLLIECTGQCACASRHLRAELMLVRKCQLSSPHWDLKSSPLFFVSLWGVVVYV